MRRPEWIVTIVAALVLAGGASAATDVTGIRSTHNRTTCAWPTGAGTVACQRADGTGYIVLVSQARVVVATADRRVSFARKHPARSPGFGPSRDKTVTFVETHHGVSCYWTTLEGGGVFCNRANRHGYVAGVTQRRAVVANETNRIVYLVTQP